MLKVGKKYDLATTEEQVVFGNTCLARVVEEGKPYLVIAAYNGHGTWHVRSKELMDMEVAYKLGRTFKAVSELVGYTIPASFVKEESKP